MEAGGRRHEWEKLAGHPEGGGDSQGCSQLQEDLGRGTSPGSRRASIHRTALPFPQGQPLSQAMFAICLVGAFPM